MVSLLDKACSMLQRKIRAAMVTVHYGVFCAKCKHFIRLGNYQAEALGKDLRDVTPGPDKLPCPKCSDKWLYQRADVAHSLWPSGRQPIYPQRD